MVDGPVSLRQTVYKSSIFTRFECNDYISRGCLYIYLMPGRGWGLLAHLKASLTYLSKPPLSHTLCLGIAFLWVCEHPSALHQEFELCRTKEFSSKRHRLVTLGSCRSLDGLEKVISWSPSRRLWRCLEISCERFLCSPRQSGEEQL